MAGSRQLLAHVASVMGVHLPLEQNATSEMFPSADSVMQSLSISQPPP